MLNLKYSHISLQSKPFLWLFTLLLFCVGCNQSNGELTIYNGVLDLTNWNFDENPEVNLMGDALFYWKQWPINNEGDFDATLLKEGTSVEWPSPVWTKLGFEKRGYGTYKLNIKQKKDSESLVLNIGRLLGAGEIWINGKKHITLGKISQDGTDEIPYGQIIYTELPQEENLDILFVVSGHYSRLGGGPALQNVIQTKSLSTANQKSNPLIEGVITFLIIIFGVFQIYWFFTFNKELYFLYFGLFCLIGVSRQLFVGETLIYSFFPNISFGIVQRMRYVGYFGGLSLIILYYTSLYPGYIKKNLVRTIYLIPVLGILYVLFTPVFYGTLIAPFFQVYGLTTMILGFYIIGCAIKNKKPYAKWVLLILVVQVIVFTNDILTAMMVIQTKFVINYSFLCYIIFHVFLNHKFQSEKERLLNQLYSNINTLKSDIDYKIEEIETLKKDTFQQIKSKERMVDNLKKVAAADEKVSIQSLIADLKSELLEDTQLVSIKNDIEGINKDFVQRIKKIHPNLTKTDLEICMYIRLSLERKEIARLRYTTVAAVKKSRYRLRKKLELEVEDDLEKYLKSI
ncbi:7TM-DISM domain-containing protein [Tenacibaculum sp. 190524A05c]|uniref:HTH luxR-type domain-containing protein n=1 Tax=Tenacibaculum platacis TaxID=3137852 RepID=A0ABM9P365_9FLAO